MSNEVVPPQQTPCPLCGGPRVNVDVSPVVQIGAKKSLFENYVSPMRGVLCVNCGLTLFYATHPTIFRNLLTNQPHK